MRDKLLGVEEAAEMLGRTTHAMYRLVERRQIPYRKSGRRVLFVESELKAFIEALPGLPLEDLREREKAGV
jgi:excisionase family DNA binding protein